MLYAIGSRVKFKHTGYEGVVTEMLGDGMLSVLLDDGDEIPAFEDDLMRIEDYRASLLNKPPVKAKVIKIERSENSDEPDLPKIEAQYSILRSLGIQLAFEALYKQDGSTGAYNLYLINDTQYDALYSFELYLGEVVKMKSNAKIDSVSYIKLDEIPFDYLNELMRIEMSVWQVTTQGTGKPLKKTIKIKAQQFFKKVRTAPLLNIPVHHYIVFESFDDEGDAEEDMKSYTEKNKRRSSSGQMSRFNHNSVTALANFNPELDLHVENLSANWQKMNNAEILRLQLKAFEHFLSEALQVGVPRVFLIHGLGKGRLRDEIASRLILHPDVETFKNDYHPNYGFGATEVIFRN